MARLAELDWNQVDVPPAPADWTDPTPSAIDDQIAAFHRLGFLVLRQAIPRDHIAAVRAALNRIASDHQRLPAIREGFNIEDPAKWGSANAPVFRKIGGIWDLDPAFRGLLNQPVILEPLFRLLGDRVLLHRDVVMMKQARAGREKPWHQDGVYWPWRPMTLVSAFMPLDPCTRANGALQVIPGSHASAVEHHGAELQVRLTKDQRAAARYVLLEPGDVLLFHCLLLHGSEPNRSEHHRRVAILSLRSAASEYVGQNERPADIEVAARGS